MLEWFYFHPIGLLTSLVWIHRYFQLLQKKKNTIFFISFSQGSNKVWVCVCVCARAHARARACAKWFQLCAFMTLWAHPMKSTRLLCPWDSPDKNTEVSCHALLQGIFPTLSLNPHLISPALADGFFTTSTFWEAPTRDQTSQKALMKSKIYHFQVKGFWVLVHFACKTDHWGFTLELLLI